MSVTARLSHERMAGRPQGHIIDGFGARSLLRRMLLDAHGIAVCSWRDESVVDRRAIGIRST